MQSSPRCKMYLFSYLLRLQSYINCFIISRLKTSLYSFIPLLTIIENIKIEFKFLHFSQLCMGIFGEAGI
jgi:hypothetical protein